MHIFQEDSDLQPWEKPPPTAIVSTLSPVAIELRRVEHELASEGSACLATYLAGKVICRQQVAEDALPRYEKLIHGPVVLALAGRERDPGLQCRLLAMIPSEWLRRFREDDEPWRSDAPTFDDADDAEDGTVPVLLGNIVRFAKDRRFPDDLPHEVGDVMHRLLGGQVSEVVDKMLDL